MRKSARMGADVTVRAAPARRRAGLLRKLLSALALTLCAAAPARAGDQFSIEASSRGGAVVLHVQSHIRARLPVIWGTLTDYDRLPQFVPSITYSRVLERRGLAAVVEQKGAAQILFFSYPIEVTVESVESPPDSISVRVLKGNLKQLEGGYHVDKIAGADNEYTLSWRGVIEPDFAVPAFINVPLMRASLKEQFLAMVKEIERRELLAVQAGP